MSWKHRGHPSAAAHVVLSWESSVVVGVHVDHCIRLHYGWRLRLVFHPPLAGERQSDLVHHGAAQRPLGKKGGSGEGHEKEKRGKGRGSKCLSFKLFWQQRVNGQKHMDAEQIDGDTCKCM